MNQMVKQEERPWIAPGSYHTLTEPVEGVAVVSEVQDRRQGVGVGSTSAMADEAIGMSEGFELDHSHKGYYGVGKGLLGQDVPLLNLQAPGSRCYGHA